MWQDFRYFIEDYQTALSALIAIAVAFFSFRNLNHLQKGEFEKRDKERKDDIQKKINRDLTQMRSQMIDLNARIINARTGLKISGKDMVNSIDTNFINLDSININRVEILKITTQLNQDAQHSLRKSEDFGNYMSIISTISAYNLSIDVLKFFSKNKKQYCTNLKQCLSLLNKIHKCSNSLKLSLPAPLLERPPVSSDAP